MAAAVMVLHGIDGMKWLRSRDPVEAAVMAALANRAQKLEDARETSRANKNSNAIWRSVKFSK